MNPFIKCTYKENIINCGFDLLILNPQGRLALVSLFDFPTIVKKALADLRHQWRISAFDYERPTWQQDFYPDNRSENCVLAMTERQDKYCHAIVRNTINCQDLIFNWHNEDMIMLLGNFLRDHQVPITDEILRNMYHKDNSIITPCTVITTKEEYTDLQVVKPNVNLINRYLEDADFLNSISSFEIDTTPWETINSIEDYVFYFLNPIVERVQNKIHSLYDPSKIEEAMFKGKYTPYAGQVIPIQSCIEVLSQKGEKFVYLASEQGTGKTSMSINILNGYFHRVRKFAPTVFMLVPATTVTQWVEEIENHFYTKDYNVFCIEKTSQFIKLFNDTGFKFTKPTFFICGKETFKLQYKQVPAIRTSIRVPDSILNRVAICPSCCRAIKVKHNDIESYLTESSFYDTGGKPKRTKENNICPHCQQSLWTATYGKTKKTSVIDFIRKRHIKFDMVVVDEAQESNNASSIIGTATNTLLRNHAKKIIALSGTPNNGYASSLYNLLMAVMPRKLFAENIYKLEDFISQYGTLEACNKKEEDMQAYMASGIANIKESDYREVEGVNPIAFVKFLAQNYVFMELKDLGKDLPPFNEYYVPIQASPELSTCVSGLERAMHSVNAFSAVFLSDSIVKHYANNPFHWRTISLNNQGVPVPVHASCISESEDILLPKEAELLKIIKSQHEMGRKVWIYVDFNHGGKYLQSDALPERLKKIILKRLGLNVFILPDGNPLGRKKLIDKNSTKYDVFMSNRKLVSVGLNLQFCPTYINYIPSNRVNDVEQANRRGWRANSTEANEVYHLYYDLSVESKVIKRYQRKKAESNAIQGKFDVALEAESVRTQSSFGKSISDKLDFFSEELPDISRFLKKEEIEEFKSTPKTVQKTTIVYHVTETSTKQVVEGQLDLLSLFG